ncbi:MAG: glucose 1-dehydrogenase [Gammaproteobacteria bacterium]|nr:glucose 1-dehydrogenase [Gammaproteobacteria bacterium]
MSVRGKVALITGAGTGIGKATTERMSADGAHVIAGIIGEEERTVASDFTQRILDVRLQSDWDAALADCREQFGGIDILVNNAGLLIEGTAEETSDATWDKIFDVNLKGLFRGCRAVIPQMRQRGGGAIVNLASIDALSGAIGHLAYSASKGGVTALTRSLATDHAVDNIRVNAVCPGTITTPMVEKMFKDTGDIDAARNASIAKHPLGRLASAGEVASVIVFLCSNDASFITGQSVSVDGGRSIR